MRISDKQWLEVKRFVRQSITSSPRSRRLFRAAPPALDDAQREVLSALQTRGLAMISFADLFGGEAKLWDSLSAEAESFAASEKVREAKRRLAENRTAGEYKAYIVRRHDDDAVIDPGDPLLAFGLDDRVLGVVNAFLGLCAKLNYCNLWYTIPLDADRAPVASQRWHRDPEDARLVKVFVYFTDVDAASGALRYIPESRRGGRYAHLWRFADASGVGGYPQHDQIEAAVPARDRVVAAGRRGTVVFCDTSGLHCGGRLASGARILGNLAYLTPASLFPRKFRCDGKDIVGTPAAHYALT
jgi:hypothetical protein